MNPKLLLRAEHAIKLYKQSQKQTNRRGRQVCKVLQTMIELLTKTVTPLPKNFFDQSVELITTKATKTHKGFLL
jgi:mRNA-degrading endonuclease YafQ of YafQ-DinJ toxin-antitoxin module